MSVAGSQKGGQRFRYTHHVVLEHHSSSRPSKKRSAPLPTSAPSPCPLSPESPPIFRLSPPFFSASTAADRTMGCVDLKRPEARQAGSLPPSLPLSLPPSFPPSLFSLLSSVRSTSLLSSYPLLVVGELSRVTMASLRFLQRQRRRCPPPRRQSDLFFGAVQLARRIGDCGALHFFPFSERRRRRRRRKGRGKDCQFHAPSPSRSLAPPLLALTGEKRETRYCRRRRSGGGAGGKGEIGVENRRKCTCLDAAFSARVCSSWIARILSDVAPWRVETFRRLCFRLEG